jgi:hypothetical protein
MNMAKRVTKEELQERLKWANQRADAVYWYARALREGTKPDAVIEVGNAYSDHHTERWTVFQAQRFFGGVILIEQFHEGELINWSVCLVCGYEVDERDYYRREALSKVYAAQRAALGLEVPKFDRVTR